MMRKNPRRHLRISRGFVLDHRPPKAKVEGSNPFGSAIVFPSFPPFFEPISTDRSARSGLVGTFGWDFASKHSFIHSLGSDSCFVWIYGWIGKPDDHTPTQSMGYTAYPIRPSRSMAVIPSDIMDDQSRNAERHGEKQDG